MNAYHDICFSALYKQLDRLKLEAKHLRRSSQIKHHEALDRIAVSLGCRDWQHLAYTVEQAHEAHISRMVGRDIAEFDLSILHEMDLRTLCKKRPDIALLPIEDLAIKLFHDLFETLRSPLLFQERAANFGDDPAFLDDRNVPGWRLNVDTPEGFLFHGQYPASGEMVALIDGSVPGDILNEYLDAEPRGDELGIVEEAREDYRGLGTIYLYDQEPQPQETTLQLAEACYNAVLASVEKQCGVTFV